jgi:hypothetical protein
LIPSISAPLAFSMLLAAATSPPAQDPPVEQKHHNIQVLQGLPSLQLIPVMAFMANSLGVTCSHCHAGKDFQSDEKPAKESARKMIVLQRAINEQQFGGKLTITCNTCHQGRVLPPATPDLANAGWQASPAPIAEETYAGEDIIGRIPVPASVTRRVVRGFVERDNGREEPKSAPFTLTAGAEQQSYETELSHPPEAARALALFLLSPLKPEQARGERWTVTASRIRRMREIPTPLGNLPEEVVYEDRRQTSSGRLPFRTQWSRADYRVTFVVDSIESDGPADAPSPAPPTRGNVHLLHDLPESKLFMAMNALAGSLGVHCDYCHVKTGERWIWASDARPAKSKARDMIRMVLDLNRSGVAATCFSCHRGSTRVARVLPLPPQDFTIRAPSPPPSLPTSEEVLRRYAEAVGAPPPMLTLHGAIESKERSGPLQVTLRSPEEATVTITTDKGPVTESSATVAALYRADKVAVPPSALTVVGIEKIDDRDAYVLETSDGTRTTRYFFDTDSALLLRRHSTIETILGPLPEQADFADYRDVSGVKLPFVIRTSDSAPWDTATRTITAAVVSPDP